MRKFIAAILILASLALAVGAVGCGSRLNYGTSSTAPNTSTTLAGWRRQLERRCGLGFKKPRMGR